MSLNPKDWTLLVVASARGKDVSPVQLQKTLFLLGKNLTPGQRWSTKFYKFRAYDYGPFDRTIYDDAEELRNEGLILIHPETGSFRNYVALPAGIERANQLRDGLKPSVTEYLDEIVTWARGLSFNDLVRAIYREYPEMKANSVFRE
ncbi:MAG: hypothetical protein A3G27_05955 [Betaproteobacteria bacterium RIFCSPLOWO2_12_FULL_66_14]|nr:MAG: hypothetical protein A3G27_05955 [Betaproteobacteria bacterium RIFCSPLOWO2_12_FULL_66_14]